jgi:hypothetical protein
MGALKPWHLAVLVLCMLPLLAAVAGGIVWRVVKRGKSTGAANE